MTQQQDSLQQKTDAKGKAVIYTYDSSNRLSSRTWVRGASTQYLYNSATGELSTVDNSDTTPE